MALRQAACNHMLLRKPRHPVAVRNILGHTSGLVTVETPTLDLLPLRGPPQATPRWRSRGHALPVLQHQHRHRRRVVEVVSGMPYEEFLDGASSARSFRPAEVGAAWAKSYKPNADDTDLQKIPIAQLRYPLDDRARQPVPAAACSPRPATWRTSRMVLNGGTFEGTRYLSKPPSAMTSRQTRPSPRLRPRLGGRRGLVRPRRRARDRHGY